MSNIITLDVGGTIMRTYKSVLDKLPFFESYLARWTNKSADPIFVDYDPELFIHLLNKLRDPNYVTPNDANIAKTYDYFGYEEPPKPSEFIFKTLNRIEQNTSYAAYMRTNKNTQRTEYEYVIRGTTSNISIFAISTKYINDIEITITSVNYTVYDINHENFPIFFKRQSNTDTWTLKKDYINMLKKMPNLNIRIIGIMEYINIYTLE